MKPHRRLLFVLGAAAMAAACGETRPGETGDDAAVVCTKCHGGVDNATGAPPRSTGNGIATTAVGVGAHTAHVQAGPLGVAYGCEECHVTPTTVDAPGHIDGVAEVVFLPGSRARSQGASPVWSRSAASCSGDYCHGATLRGGSNTVPVWTRVGQGQASCGTCHGLPPPTGKHSEHVDGLIFDCDACHAGYLAGAVREVNRALHIDGAFDVSLPATVWNPVTGTCAAYCHGSRAWR